MLPRLVVALIIAGACAAHIGADAGAAHIGADAGAAHNGTAAGAAHNGTAASAAKCNRVVRLAAPRFPVPGVLGVMSIDQLSIGDACFSLSHLSGGVALDWIDSGFLDAAVVGGTAFQAAAARGAKVVAVAAPYFDIESNALVARDGLNKLADLRHKTLWVTEGSNAHYLLLGVLETASVDARNVTLKFAAPAGITQAWSHVPQANPTQQKVAINSLPSFSSCVDNFVVVAPSTVHTSTGLTCDLASFHARCWCRAEIAGCWARNGTEDIYISTESGITRLFPGGEDDPLNKEAIDVFDGDLTCCRLGHPDAMPCDREALVRPMLGLFHEIYRNRHGSRRDAWAVLEPRISTLYPRSFDWKHTGVDGDITERAPLLGDLIDAAKISIDTEQADDEGHGLSKFSGFAPGTNSQRHISRPTKKVRLLELISSVTAMRPSTSKDTSMDSQC